MLERSKPCEAGLHAVFLSISLSVPAGSWMPPHSGLKVTSGAHNVPPLRCTCRRAHQHFLESQRLLLCSLANADTAKKYINLQCIHCRSSHSVPDIPCLCSTNVLAEPAVHLQPADTNSLLSRQNVRLSHSCDSTLLVGIECRRCNSQNFDKKLNSTIGESYRDTATCVDMLSHRGKNVERIIEPGTNADHCCQAWLIVGVEFIAIYPSQA